jgi:hypothetical protein
MKKLVTLFILCQFIAFYTATSQVITFSAKDKNNNPLQIDSIRIKNLVIGKSITVNNTVIDIAALNLTAVEDNQSFKEKFNIALSENSVHDFISLLLSIPYESNISISLINLLGVEITEKRLFLSSGEHIVNLDAPNLSVGVYFVRMNDSKNYTSLKFIRNNNSEINETIQNIVLKNSVCSFITDQHEFTVYSKSCFPSTISEVIPEDGKNYEFILIPSDFSNSTGTFIMSNIPSNYHHNYINSSSTNDTKSWDDVLNLNYKIEAKNDYPKDFVSKITGSHAIGFNCYSCELTSIVSDTIRFCYESNKKYQRCESSFIKFYLDKENSKINVFLAEYSNSGLTTGDHGGAWDELQFEISSVKMNFTVNQKGEFIAKVKGNDLNELNPDIKYHKLYYTSWPGSIDPYHEEYIANVDEFKSVNQYLENSVIELILK